MTAIFFDRKDHSINQSPQKIPFLPDNLCFIRSNRYHQVRWNSMIFEGFTSKKSFGQLLFDLDFYPDWGDTISNSTRHASDTSGPGRVFFFVNQSEKQENL